MVNVASTMNKWCASVCLSAEATDSPVPVGAAKERGAPHYLEIALLLCMHAWMHQCFSAKRSKKLSYFLYYCKAVSSYKCRFQVPVYLYDTGKLNMVEKGPPIVLTATKKKKKKKK